VLQNACEALAERLKPYKLAKPDGTWKDWVISHLTVTKNLSSLHSVFVTQLSVIASGKVKRSASLSINT
jgi:hypothetical protein